MALFETNFPATWSAPQLEIPAVEFCCHVSITNSPFRRGKTIVERDTWTSFFYPDGSRDVGLTVHIQGPGGIVQRDAGQVVRDVNGNLVYVIGPHDQALGGSFCPALAH